MAGMGDPGGRPSRPRTIFALVLAALGLGVIAFSMLAGGPAPSPRIPAGTEDIGIGPLPFAVRGRLVHAFTRAPIPREEVFVSRSVNARKVRAAATVTGKDGSFALAGKTHPSLGNSLCANVDGFIPLWRMLPSSAVAGEANLGEVEMFPAGSLEVHVLDEEGKPVPGARVEVTAPREGGGRLHADFGFDFPATDGRGISSMTRLRPGAAWVAAAKSGHAPAAFPEAVEIVPEEMQRVVIRFPPPRPLRVRAVDDDGKPVPDAQVDADIQGGDGSPLEAIDRVFPRYTTGAAGGTDVPRGEYAIRLRVGRDGFQDAEIGVAPEATEVEVKLSRQPELEWGALRGTIVHAGRPVPGFWLQKRVTAEGPFIDTYGAADGSFHVRAPPGRSEWEVTSPEFVPSRFSVDLAPRETKEIAIELSRGIVVAGIIRSAADGKPMPGVRMHFDRVPQKNGYYPFTCTGADGRFRASGLEAGGYEVRIDGDACGNLVREGPLDVHEPIADLDFSIPPRTALILRIRDEHDIPLERFDLELQPGEERCARPFEFVSAYRSKWGIAGARDREGIDLLPDLDYRIEVKTGNTVLLVLPAVRLKPREIRELDASIARLPCVRGRAGLADGSPAKKAIVSLRSAGAAARSVPAGEAPDRRWTYADGDGRFVLYGCPPGRCACEASWKEATSRIDVIVPESGPAPFLKIPLGGSLSIAGEVIDGDGRPIHGATVLVRKQECTSDADGRFRLFGFAEGERFEIRAEMEGWYAEPIVTQPSYSIRLALRPGAILRGRILDAEGQPAPEARAILALHGASSAAGSAEGGAFSFDHLPPGPYRLLVASWYRGAAVVPFSLAAGDRRSQDVRLAEPVEIRGVATADGADVGEATASALAATGDAFDGAALGWEATGPEGWFRVRAGNVFPMRLRVEKAGFERWERTLRDAGEIGDAPVRVELKRAREGR